MKKRTHARIVRNRTHSMEKSDISWSYVLLTIFCVATVAAGFFFAALQHFATIDLGFKNSKLRKQVDDLNSEKRRLLLAKEIALSPSEITKTAKSLGFREVEAEVVSVADSISNGSVKPSEGNMIPVKLTSDPRTGNKESELKEKDRDKNKDKKPAADESVKLTKTSMSAPVRERQPVKQGDTASLRSDSPKQNGESRVRRVVDNAEKKDKNIIAGIAKLR